MRSVREELRDFNRLPVWQALAIGAIGFSGMFCVFAYIAPTMLNVTRVSADWIPLGLIGFGVGGVVGNLFGGWLFDRLRFRAVPVILLQNTLGVMFLFVFVAIATGLLIYNGVTREKYVKTDDTMVEEFKAWKQNSRQKDQAANAVIGSLWLIAVCVYMLVSFATGAWHLTWIIFLITAAVASIIKGIFMLKK